MFDKRFDMLDVLFMALVIFGFSFAGGIIITDNHWKEKLIEQKIGRYVFDEKTGEINFEWGKKL